MRVERCISCRQPVAERCARYCMESICTECWKTLPPFIWRPFHWNVKLWRRIEKAENRGERVDPAFWPTQAVHMARTWSRIRITLEVKPEFPAGLAHFLKEMGW